MTMRAILPAIGSILAGYFVLIVVQLLWGRTVDAGLFIVALGGAFGGGFGYWLGERRRRQQRQ
ncbi:MAG: hypothetical protein ACLQUY_05160 [Ktedonobacterales bacterium]